MKPFRFQKFEIQQSKNVFRVGTDGVLLGALCDVSNAGKVLEIGSGTGLISLMIAQRNSFSDILALDINEVAVNLTKQNFENSPFFERLKVAHEDFKNFQTPEKFDFIVSNPPYFDENCSQKDVLARQNVELNFKDLIEKSSKFLKEKGILSVIIPSDSTKEFIETANDFKLNLVRKVNIFGIENGVLKRNILEFSKSEKSWVEEHFVIEKSPRKYSDQYLELTKEFHIFGK